LNGWSQLAVAAYSPGQFRWRFLRQHIGPGGIPNIIIALVVGTVLTLFYLWRRDLVANMIGHGLSLSRAGVTALFSLTTFTATFEIFHDLKLARF
jgi:hypothetical protein